jgi:hypothetical protein
MVPAVIVTYGAMTDSQTHIESNKTENCIHVLVVLNVWYTTYGQLNCSFCKMIHFTKIIGYLIYVIYIKVYTH